MTTCPRGEEVPEAPRRIFTFEEARPTGLLWAINKVLMHPRGFALAFEYPDGSELEDIKANAVAPMGFSVVGDGSEPWSFAEGLDEEGFAAFEEFLTHHRAEPGPQGKPLAEELNR